MSWDTSGLADSSGLSYGVAFNYVEMKLIPHLPFSIDPELLKGMYHVCSILNPPCLGQSLAHIRSLISIFE